MMNHSASAESTVGTRTIVTPPPRLPRGAWWLPGPHLPTVMGKFRRVDLPRTTRERWPTADGDLLTVARLAGQARAPRLIILHGLEGGLHSTYVRGLLQQAVARGWWADVVLWRTCDGEPVNAVRRSYHSGASDDAGFAIDRIVAADARRPTFLLGVSLGGNVLLKWLGERGASVASSIRGAAAVSVPFDLAMASRKIDSGVSRMYSRFFLRTLRAKVAAKLERFPDLVDRKSALAARTLWEFDDAVTAPLHGFANAADYYARASSIQFLGAIHTPTLLLNAENDPFLPRTVLDRVRAIAQKNPQLHCAFPATGGHVGFMTGALPWDLRCWMEQYCMDWFHQIDHVYAAQ